jgi:CRP-like cAMP-binding protein
MTAEPVAHETSLLQPNNRILQRFAQLQPEVYRQFVQSLEMVTLERGAVLGASRTRAEFVYFVEQGIVSLVATTRAGHSLDIAIIGTEGAAGVADALGHRPLPYGWVVQLPGRALRTPTAIVRDHVRHCSDLHDLLLAYAQLLIHQLAQSALCNRFHTARQRLARWLLMASERAGTPELALTHELIAQMVGAPRSAVTNAAARLRHEGIIDYRRGIVTIRNSRRLQQSACECFHSIAKAIRDEGPSEAAD